MRPHIRGQTVLYLIAEHETEAYPSTLTVGWRLDDIEIACFSFDSAITLRGVSISRAGHYKVTELTAPIASSSARTPSRRALHEHPWDCDAACESQHALRHHGLGPKAILERMATMGRKPAAESRGKFGTPTEISMQKTKCCQTAS